MDKKKGKRINFKIVHCSSEDPEYPASELLQQSPEAKGWQNKRFATYPQTIVVELFETSIINKIAVLSHQSKIASKVEFEIKAIESDEWKKLGRISLDNNANTNYQARELKQANINDIEARFIRLVFRANHVNNQNIFNQVGVISVSFYGVRSEDLPPIQDRFANSKSSSGDMDSNTRARIIELEAKKKRAVQQEQYDLAKDIKDEIDRIKTVSSQIAALEQRKQEAVKRQNYDDAKLINEQIKRLRQGGQEPPPPQRQRQSKPTYRQPERRQVQQQPPVSISPMTNNRNNPVKYQPPPMEEKPRQERKQEPPPQNVNKNMNRKQSYDDDRPIVVKNTNPYDEPQQNQIEAPIKKQRAPINKPPPPVQQEEPQHFDQKPIKSKPVDKSGQRSRQAQQQQQQDLDAGNEFIQIPKKGAKVNKNVINEEEICQFCKRVDKRFVEQDYKDMHYFNACPMISICSECGQGIEVSNLTSHLVGECANSKYYKKCPRCKQAVHQKGFKAHVEKKQCLPAKPLAANNRCPLCHLDINAGVNGWKEHLVDEGCENNPRA